MVLLDVALSKRRNHMGRGARVIIPSVHHHCSQIIWRFLTHDAVGNAKFGFPIKCGSGKLLGSGQVLLARKINFVFLPYLEHEGIYYSINNIFDIPAVKCTCYSEVTSWNSMDFIWRSLPFLMSVRTKQINSCPPKTKGFALAPPTALWAAGGEILPFGGSHSVFGQFELNIFTLTACTM